MNYITILTPRAKFTAHIWHFNNFPVGSYH